MAVLKAAITLSISLLPSIAFSQAQHCAKMGTPVVKNYFNYQYHGGHHISPIAELDNGTILFSDLKKLFTFNGTNFQHSNPPLDHVNFTAIHFAKDTLWVGSNSMYRGDFGYVPKNDLGQFLASNYVSLSAGKYDSIGHHGINFVTSYRGDIYYLLQGSALARWKNGKIEMWPVHGYRNIFEVNGKLYIPSSETIFLFENDSLKPLTDIWDTEEQGWARAMLPLENGSVFIASRNKAYAYDGHKLMELNDFRTTFRDLEIWRGVVLPDGHLALGTLNAGLLILEQDGKVCQVIDESDGLSSNIINNLYYSSRGHLWVSGFAGLNRVDFPSDFTYFDRDDGIRSEIRCISATDDLLIIGNRNGVYYLDSDSDKKGRFKLFPGSSEMWVKSFSKIGDTVFVGTVRKGLYYIQGQTMTKIQEVPDAGSISGIIRLKRAQGLYLIQYLGYLGLMEQTRSGRWVYHGEIMDLRGEFGLVEDDFGNIWVPIDYGAGVTRLSFPDGMYQSGNDEKILDCLINGEVIREVYPGTKYGAQFIDGKVLSFANDDILKFDYERNEFVKDSSFTRQYGAKFNTVYGIVKGYSNDYWFYSSNSKGRMPIDENDSLEIPVLYYHATQESGKFTWDNNYFNKLIPYAGSISLIYPHEDGSVWFSGANGRLVRYHPSTRREINNSGYVQINRVKFLNSDSILYAGNSQHVNSEIDLEYQQNDLRFNYGALLFLGADSVYYRHRLDGYSDVWSSWSHETTKDFTGLKHGEYTFIVEAVSPDGKRMNEASFAFTIHPPWYFTWWAYLIYASIAAVLIYTIVKIRVNSLEKEKSKLEQTVIVRTSQLNRSMQKLKQMNELKSRFFANISHEFRTPLTLILGNIKRLRNQGGDHVKSIESSAQQLLQLVNQLLELARIDAGEISVNNKPIDLNKLTRQIISNYSSLAEDKGITLEFRQPKKLPLVCELDKEKVQVILHNLLSNAFKFTRRGGRIEVVLKVTDSDDAIVISVSDNGKGISAQDQKHIFKRFFQVEPSFVSKSYGTGIGLSVVKEFVDAMSGRIALESSPGKGSVFTITLPYIECAEISASKPDVHVPEPKVISHKKSVEPISTVEDRSTVLIVEDNPDMRDFIRSCLDGYNVIEAENGKPGLDLAIRHIPDIIISDVMMDEMDGMALLQQLRADVRTSHIPIIMLTALEDRETKIQGYKFGADDYLTKPFDEEELLLLIENRLWIRSQLRKKWSENPDNSLNSMEDQFLETLKKSIDSHLNDADFSVNELADAVNMSRSQLHRKLKALINLSASKFIRKRRLEKACKMIRANSATIAEIAYETGFNSPQYFSHCFHEAYGCAPGKLREMKEAAGEES